jgi:hypothetical protein
VRIQSQGQAGTKHHKSFAHWSFAIYRKGVHRNVAGHNDTTMALEKPTLSNLRKPSAIALAPILG